jgi:hypothetical protein
LGQNRSHSREDFPEKKKAGQATNVVTRKNVVAIREMLFLFTFYFITI